MRKLLIALLAAVAVLAFMDMALAQGKGGGKGQGGGVGPGAGGGQQPGPKGEPKADPKPGEPRQDPKRHEKFGEEGKASDPEILRAVRMLRKLVWKAREMIEKKAKPEEIEKVEEKIRKVIRWLKEQNVDWKGLSKRKKCNLDPEVRKLMQALEWCHNEMKGLDPEKDKKKVAKIRKKIQKIMQALRKMHVCDKDLPEELCPKKEGEGKCERKRDGSCGECEGCKGEGESERKKDGSCGESEGNKEAGECHRERKREGSGEGGCGGCGGK